MPEKDTDKSKPVFRPIVLSLKVKITILVLIVLIFTIFLVVRFNIKQQNDILDQQQQKTMSGYLLPFRQNLIRLFLLNEKERDLKTLQQYVLSFKNIPSFKMAMFVDAEGDILFHSDSSSIGGRVSISSRNLFHTNYTDQIHSDFRIFEAEIQTYTTKSGQTKAYTNDRIDSYDGFLPVYMDYPGHRYLESIDFYQNKNQSAVLFRLHKLPQETINGFIFGQSLEEIYHQFYQDGKKTSRAENLLKDKKISDSDLKRIRFYYDYFQDFKSSGDLIISPKNFEKLMETLVNSGLNLTKAADYIKWKQKDILFSHNNLLDKDQKRNLRFIVFLEKFLDRYQNNKDQDKQLADFQKLVSEKNITVSTSYYIARLRELSRVTKEIMKYRTEGKGVTQEELHAAFAELYGFFRLGTVRVILNLEDLTQLQKRANNSTIDTAVVFILRMLVIVFLVVSFIIAPLNILGEGTTVIAQGDLDKKIEIPNHDEIGQLADKFNFMSQNLKKAFDEVKDKTRMEEELRIAQEIQTAILPQSLPDIPGYSFSVYYEPQTESGGDYYDFIDLENDLFAIVVADVTNHGVGAAMVMSVLRSALRTFSVRGKNAAQVIKDINPVLLRDTPPNMFATVFYGVLNRETRELFYSIAGHNQGILYNKESKKLRLMKSGGMPVGMLAPEMFNPHIELFKTQLQPGDYFIQYSDGITEAKSSTDEEYGEDRFYLAIQKYCDPDLDKMRNGIIQEVKEFTAGTEQSDDITLIIMRVETNEA